jgi:CubicO group peptidase (beta-lactamase class C family)
MSRSLLSLVTAALILPVASLAQTPAPTPDQLAPIFKDYDHTDTPGCAAAVNFQGHDMWSAAYGMADLEHNVVNTPATVFEAGSVSKQFTAAAVLLLVERGKVSLEDDIRKYFPELPVYDKPIPVRELLNHTSGLRDWGSVEAIAGWPRTTREYTHARVLEILSRQHALNYTPGDAWSYTNSGYNLAAMLVERVSGMTLQAFDRMEFFEPLGMTSTQWRDDFRRVVPNRAIAYEEHDKQWRQDMPFEDTYGHGGLLTTVSDLLKWNDNISSGKLHPEIFAQMQKPSTLNDGRRVGYGLGLFLEEFDGLPEVDHSGATAGYRAWLGRIPSKGLSIAVLCNAAQANPTGYAQQITRLYLGLPKPDAAAKVIHSTQETKPGLYRNRQEHWVIDVEDAKGAVTFNGLPAWAPVRFAGDTMIMTNSVYGDDVWDRVQAWTPSPTAKDLSAFVGTYASDEAETVLRVALEDGKLIIHRRPDASFTLKPTYEDAFGSDLAPVHFERNAAGKVIALTLGDSRVWELRLTREADSKPDATLPPN